MLLYLKDYPKAEQYYEQAVSIYPQDPNNYRALFELYVYHYKQNTTAATDILKKRDRGHTSSHRF